MPTLYIYCGIPASGKSYYAKKAQHKVHYISRDEIRFNMVEENEEYFSKEKAVLKLFSTSIAKVLENGQDVIADATHISKASRAKLIKAIDGYFAAKKIESPEYKIACVVFDTPFEVCCERNAARVGRARVPDEVMRRFANGWEFPEMEEDARIKEIDTVVYVED